LQHSWIGKFAPDPATSVKEQAKTIREPMTAAKTPPVLLPERPCQLHHNKNHMQQPSTLAADDTAFSSKIQKVRECGDRLSTIVFASEAPQSQRTSIPPSARHRWRHVRVAVCMVVFKTRLQQSTRRTRQLPPSQIKLKKQVHPVQYAMHMLPSPIRHQQNTRTSPRAVNTSTTRAAATIIPSATAKATDATVEIPGEEALPDTSMSSLENERAASLCNLPDRRQERVKWDDGGGGSRPEGGGGGVGEQSGGMWGGAYRMRRAASALTFRSRKPTGDEQRSTGGAEPALMQSIRDVCHRLLSKIE
jgi:hypothetical protein